MNTKDDVKRKLLEAVETALLRSPFYDEKSRREAMQELENALSGPPLDDVANFMSPERAEFVRKCRIDERYTFRAVAAGLCQGMGCELGLGSADRRGPLSCRSRNSRDSAGEVLALVSIVFLAATAAVSVRF